MCFLGLLRGMAGVWRTVDMTCTCLGNFCWEIQMREIGWGGGGGGDHRKKNFLISL